jgi:putative spermidine/putrescine transport system ATP-binding protein
MQELRLQGVTRRFGDVRALSGMDLTIRGGEFIALLGPSGCGKSTALNCVAGLLPLSEGEIWLDGERIDGLPPERRGFGMVFQSYALFPHLSARANVAFGLAMRGVAKAEQRERVEEALRLVRLERRADRFPAQLSGGEQQRVAIARAVVVEPPLVLMDEPLSNLDAKLRIELRTEVRRLHQELGLTTVYVTHDQEEALSLADRVVVLRDGRVQEVGTPEEVYLHPVNRYVADFMGYRNMLELDVEGVEGEDAVLAGQGLRLLGRSRRAPRNGRAVAAIRPDDFVVGEEGDSTVEVTVQVVEYRGRDWAVEAAIPSGGTVHFVSRVPLAPGDRTVLGVSRERVLVFDVDTTDSAPTPNGSGDNAALHAREAV